MELLIEKCTLLLTLLGLEESVEGEKSWINTPLVPPLSVLSQSERIAVSPLSITL